jgi:hypothetical protein
LGHSAKNEGPLFLASGKDANNQSFTYLPAFMPYESMWVFNWLYSKAMSTLLSLGPNALKETRLSLTDGDKNKYSPLESLILDIRFVAAWSVQLSPGRLVYGVEPFW